MADVTVKQFAEVVGISIDRLLEQLKEAGVNISDADADISDEEKMELLGHLRNKHGKSDSGGDTAGAKKITLNRRSTSELKLTGSHGKGKSVTVEVRKKRTYVKRSVVLEQETERVEQERAKREELEAEQKRLEEDPFALIRNHESSWQVQGYKRNNDQSGDQAKLQAALYGCSLQFDHWVEYCQGNASENCG